MLVDNDARVRELLSRTDQELRDRKIDCSTPVDEGDLLVIGNRGMQRGVLGSVANTVTHKAPCSVYVVKTT